MGEHDSERGKTLYPAGEYIDRFEIVRRIDYGSTSDVYEARDPSHDRTVALKVLNQRRLRDPQARARFQREASVHAMIRHRNVAKMYGSGITGTNEPYLVLELFDGRSLRDVLNREGPIDIERACSYSLQALDGLAACHAVGVRHRDLKPENMMLRDVDGGTAQVALIDFGFATFEGQRRLTATGFVVGTLSYVAPERLHGDPGDVRADIYAMGVVLFELLTGEVPFEGEDLEVAHRHLDETPPPPSEVAPDRGISRELDAVVTQALAKDPAERFQSAEAMANALSRALMPAKPSRPPVEATLWYCDTDGVEHSRVLGYEPVLVGRGEECAIRSDDPLLSRQHARIYCSDDGSFWIEDLGSTNGVWVGVNKVTSAPIPFDDIVLVGSLIFDLRADESQTDLRPGIHTRLWQWLKAERAARAAVEDERNALGRRVGELHRAVQQLSTSDAAHPALAEELERLNASNRELRAAAADAEVAKDELAVELADARREFSKALQKHMANVFAAQSESARLGDQLDARGVELEDLRARLRERDTEVKSLRKDLEALSGVATVGAGQEALALVAAQSRTTRLAERVEELELTVDEQRGEMARLRGQLDQRSPHTAAEVNELEERIRALGEELEKAQWTHHKEHAGEVRMRLQLEAALAELGAARADADAAWAEVAHLREQLGGND